MEPQDVIAQTLKNVSETGTYESDAQAIIDALRAAGYDVVRRLG